MVRAYGDHKSGNPAVAMVFAEAAKEHGMSQNDLADALGVSTPTISRIMSARRAPSFELTIKLCHLLDISVKTMYDAIERAAAGGDKTGGPESDLVSAAVRRREADLADPMPIVGN